jgi:anti-sigma regulatory factor (Ser/Thr protein kinase)
MGKPVTGQENSEISIAFTANFEFVRPLRHFLTSLCEVAKYDEEETEGLALVVTEILNNAIEHGCSGPSDEIQLSLTVEPKEFRFEVFDAGCGGQEFANGALELARKMPNLEEPRGRGLFLIQSYMDVFDVHYDSKSGTRVLISKSRDP